MEKQYKVLALKYRPQNFSQLIGQDVLVQTLSNAIKTNRIHHAFILTGIRGVGKTTTARLIAKSLNCLSSDKPIINVCNQCEHCKSIATSSDPDVIEFDAASHTGVDDIRPMIDDMAYAPINSRYKVYIIDEVHMLSKSAFNELLKTLEEPPAYVKFTFATTAIRKVPITILSRCQRFDLRRLSYEEIKDYLLKISKNEGYEIEENALSILANFSEGSVRDSLSLLDRTFSYNDFNQLITEAKVSEMLGLSSKKNVYDLFISILEGNTNQALKQFDDMYLYTIDTNVLLQDLLQVNHNMILAKTLNNFFEISHIPTDQVEIIKNTINNVSLSSLVRVWQMLLNGEKQLKSSFNSKKIMDIIIINICYSSGLPSIEDILKDDSCLNVEKKEEKLDLKDMILNLFEDSKVIE